MRWVLWVAWIIAVTHSDFAYIVLLSIYLLGTTE